MSRSGGGGQRGEPWDPNPGPGWLPGERDGPPASLCSWNADFMPRTVDTISVPRFWAAIHTRTRQK